MEDVTLDASNLFASEGDNAVLDTDVYDQEGYDVPDPGVLSERHGEGTYHCPDTPLRGRYFSDFGSVAEVELPWTLPDPSCPSEEGSVLLPTSRDRAQGYSDTTPSTDLQNWVWTRHHRPCSSLQIARGGGK